MHQSLGLNQLVAGKFILTSWGNNSGRYDLSAIFRSVIQASSYSFSFSLLLPLKLYSEQLHSMLFRQFAFDRSMFEFHLWWLTVNLSFTKSAWAIWAVSVAILSSLSVSWSLASASFLSSVSSLCTLSTPCPCSQTFHTSVLAQLKASLWPALTCL